MAHTVFHGTHVLTVYVRLRSSSCRVCFMLLLLGHLPDYVSIKNQSSKCQMVGPGGSQWQRSFFNTIPFMDLSCLGIRILSGEGDSYSYSQHGTHAKSSCLYSPSTNFPRTSSPNIMNDTYTRTTIPVCPLQHFRQHGKTFHDALPGTTQWVYLRLVASHGCAE